MFLTKQLIRHEGVRLKPYRCPAGKITIGVGRNLEDNGISRSEAMYMLAHDMATAKAVVDQILDRYNVPKWKVSQPRQDALANVAFNIGKRSLMGLKKMFGAIWREDWEEAAAQLLDSKYADDVGQRAVELAEQIRSGVYQTIEKGGSR